MAENGRQRLTSWKEITAYLGRDVRTVLRWEKERGLPVHRLAKVTGGGVFAYTDELDAWSKGELPESPPLNADPPPSRPAPRGWIIAALIAAAVTGVAWTVLAWRGASHDILKIEVKPDGIVASGPDGKPRWRHAFPPGERVSPLQTGSGDAVQTVAGTEPGLLAGTSSHSIANGTDTRGGRIFWFSRDGELRRTFGFDDRLTFGSGSYGAPWVITDFRVDDSSGRRTIAVAAHHNEWWPSMITALGDRWERRGTFVNAGWIERLFWIDRHRLMIAGFSNPLQGGMIALLDADKLDGQSPAPPAPGQDYRCLSCGPGTPIRYVVMPRSEVNRASASPFNRVVLETKPYGFVARTIEIPATRPEGVVDVLYEFTPLLQLVRATYSDRYWDVHRAIEAAGTITHTRAHCPDRFGPREIFVWEPSTGWTTQAIAHAAISDPPEDR